MTTKKIVVFGYKTVSPKSMNWAPVVDCRVLTNPYDKRLNDEVMRDRVRRDPLFAGVVSLGLVALQDHEQVFVGCLYGRHRSRAVALEIAEKSGAEVVYWGTLTEG